MIVAPGTSHVPQRSKSPADLDRDQAARLAEYAALRDEIILRVQLRSNITALSITAFATIIALTASATFPVAVLFVYPVFAFFMAHEWTYHDLRTYALGTYIKEEIESVVSPVSWEHYHDKIREKQPGIFRMSRIAAGGMFLASGVICVALALLSSLKEDGSPPASSWILVVMDILALAGTIWVLTRRNVHTENKKAVVP